MVHYENPKIVCGCIPEWEEKVLLCRRAIEPRYGYWTLPAGFMEIDETVTEGAIRETLEEATANVEVLGLYCVFSLPHVNHLYMMFRSRLLDLDFKPGAESLELALFSEEEVPWGDLAFTTVKQTLQFYFQEFRVGHFSLHAGDMIKQNTQTIYLPGPSCFS